MVRGSLVALVTPMLEHGAIDYSALGALLEWHIAEGTDGIVIGGTTGEAPTLQPDELARLVGEAHAKVAGRVPVIAGCGTHGTRSTVELTERVCEAGADACLVVTPYYNKPTQAGLYAHFRAVADASSCPVILYNVPSRTACDLLPETVARLAEHPRIVGLKEAVPDLARGQRVLELCGERVLLYSGDDASALDLMCLGAAGVISVTANVAPGPMHRMAQRALRGEQTEARRIDATLRPLHEALFLEANPMPVKWALHALGRIAAGIRLPLTPLSAKHHDALRRALQAASVT